jgi:hypothetical protein
MLGIQIVALRRDPQAEDGDLSPSASRWRWKVRKCVAIWLKEKAQTEKVTEDRVLGEH